MQVVQILHIPSGEYLTSANRNWNNNYLLFSDVESAEHMIVSIISHKSYISGAPLQDYKIGSSEITQDFCKEEFEYINTNTSAPQKILTL